MDLTLTMTKNVDLENSSKLEPLDFHPYPDPSLGYLSLELDTTEQTAPGCRLVTLASYHLETPGYILLLMDYTFFF